MFSCEFCKISKYIFFAENLWAIDFDLHRKKIMFREKW